MKPVILIFIQHYLPGFKGGGPIQTIVNMVNAIGDRYSFYIVTSDRDLHDKKPYPGIRYHEWTKVGKSFVLYLSLDEQNLLFYTNLLSEIDFDLLYCQSFFNPRFTILPLLALWFSANKKKPVLLAPRGEFASGALAQKSLKKRLYLLLFKNIIIHLFNYSFQCSSSDEKNDLDRILGKKVSSFTALDFNTQPHIDKSSLNISQSEELKIVFLSRIDPKKNIDYAIHILSKLKTPIVFDIFGNYSDMDYAHRIQSLASNAPKNIQIALKGPIPHQDIFETLQNYDLFFLPTKNENFGHVIHEALLSGLPVLISDQTPWHELESRNAGWEIPLDSPDLFVKTIKKFISLNKEQRMQMQFAALQYGIDVSNNQQTICDNIHMFESLFGNK